MKKILSILFCILMVIGCFSVAVCAEEEVKKPIINVSSTSAVPGDVIVVDVSIDQNPGIMAMTFTLCYDKNTFSYNSYKRGVLSDYLVVDHPDRGYVSFVNCESKNKDANGTLFSVEFTVKDNAQAGTYNMEVKHIRPDTHGNSMSGCFADWQGSKIKPVVNNGKVSIGYTGTNCKHSFGDWVVTVPPLCSETGINTKTCSICGHSTTKETPMVDHKFESFWTVDRVASGESSGLLTRHCEMCDKTTDKVTFTEKQATAAGFKNKLDEHIFSTDWKNLEEIENDNRVNQEKPDNEEQNEQTENTAPEVSAPENTPSDTPDVPTGETVLPENADQLISSSKKPLGLGVRIYRLFFGNQSQDGIFSLIEKSVPEALEWVIEYKFVILAIAIIAIIL